MSLLLQLQGGCPQTYLDLYQPLLVPQLWECGGNVQPLVRLLSSIIEKNPSKPAEKLEPLLGVFQKLLASRTNDVHGFTLLKAVTCYIPDNAMQDYWKSVFLGANIFQKSQDYRSNNMLSFKIIQILKGFLKNSFSRDFKPPIILDFY